MSTIKKLEECHLTVLSQSFYAFWSEDNYHHHHENVAGMMMMSGNSFQPIQQLVKDDVFLAQPYPAWLSLDQDDTASLSSHSSISTQQDQNNNKFVSPYLSPVSSPTQFLSNNEPLFDGIEDQLLLLPCSFDYDYDDNDDDDDKKYILKRSHQEEEEEEVEDNTQSHQKRRKKTKSTTPSRYRKIQQQQQQHQKEKKKTKQVDTTYSSNNSHCQLIEEAEDNSDTTLFQQLTESGIDWCRYCGTTEGVNWRPGPWGKRTLCNKHGCDYKGYGLASRQPRLDLSAFIDEELRDRIRPVIQQFCILCQSPQEKEDDHLIVCEGGCSRAYHQQCHTPVINVNQSDPVRWYCSTLCKENRRRNKVVVELPRKHMPLQFLHLMKKKI